MKYPIKNKFSVKHLFELHDMILWRARLVTENRLYADSCQYKVRNKIKIALRISLYNAFGY